MKTVHVIKQDWSHATRQGLYLDRSKMWLYPNVVLINEDGSINFETNSIGLKGEELDSSKMTCVVWGDSVVFGIEKSWVYLLNQFSATHQFLNGGIEGDKYQGVLKRAVTLNSERDIALNIILLGWHNKGDNKNILTDLGESLPKINNPVLVTMPTSLNSKMLDRDPKEYLRSDGHYSTKFGFWGSWECTRELAAELYKHIQERNSAIRSAGSELGVPVIDLFEILRSDDFPDFRKYFFDVCHPRPGIYPELSQRIFESLKTLGIV